MAMSKTQTVAFGIGAIGKDFMYAITASFVLYYYQNELGLSATFVAVIMMVARLFDAFNDPLMGILVAKTKTKWGRFRPWIFSGSIINALVCFWLFAVPDGVEGGSLMVWFAVAYILWGMTYTLMDVPFWSIVPAATDTPSERETLSVVGRSCAGIGGTVISSFGLIMATAFAGDGPLRYGFTWLALGVSIAFVVFEIICCIGVRERHAVVLETSTIGDMLKALIRNDQAIVVVVMILIVNSSVYLTSNSLIYYFQYNIGGLGWEGTYTLFTLVGSLVQLATMSFVYPIARRFFSNPTLFRLSLGLWIIGFALLFIYQLAGWNQVPIVLILTTPLIYVPQGITTVQTTVFLSGTVDYGELKTGHRDESVIFSMQTFIVKAASAVAVMIVGIGLDVIGLVTTNEVVENPDVLYEVVYDGAGNPVTVVQEPWTQIGLVVMMTIIPIIGIICGFVFFQKKFKLTDEAMELNAQKVLERRVSATLEYAETGQIPEGMPIGLNENGSVPDAKQAEWIAEKDMRIFEAQIEHMMAKTRAFVDPSNPRYNEVMESAAADFDKLLNSDEIDPDFLAEVKQRAFDTIDPTSPNAEEMHKMMENDFDTMASLHPAGLRKRMEALREKKS